MPEYRPGFFLIGAPKCGTSALAYALAEHPQVCFSYPKEPYYWAFDYPGIRRQFGVESLEEYLRLFEKMSDERFAGGEGSTLYLSSAVAVKKILDFQPDARFIVMLRNPADLVVSAHLQELSHLNENEPRFQNAWRLQETRAQGNSVPPGCYEPALLQYRTIARLGFQIERLFQQVPRERVHLIFFEEFQASLPQVYSGVTKFLGLQSDGRTSFPRVNDSKVPRYRWLTRLLNGRTGTRVSRFLKRSLTGRAAGIANYGKKLLSTRATKREPLPPEFSEELAQEFRDDIRLLAELTHRDLSAWENSSQRVKQDVAGGKLKS